MAPKTVCGMCDDFLADDLPQTEREAFEQHLDGCEPCRRAVAEGRWIEAQVEIANRSIRLPDGLAERIATLGMDARPAESKVHQDEKRLAERDTALKRRRLTVAAVISTALVLSAAIVVIKLGPSPIDVKNEPGEIAVHPQQVQEHIAAANTGDPSNESSSPLSSSARKARPSTEVATVDPAPDARDLVRVYLPRKSNTIIVPIQTESPNVSIFWLQPPPRPRARVAGEPQSSISSTSNRSKS